MDSEQLHIKEIGNSKEKVLSKGSLLEYRIQRLFFAMGYYTKTGIIVKSGQDAVADVITDLDVYGIYIHRNFTSKRIWADCKSGKAKPLERISWIKGIRSTIRIDDIIFVKSGVRTNTKQFAHRSGIMVLDESIISKLESDYEVDADDWSGPWNPRTQENMLAMLKAIDKTTRGICSRSSDFIASTYWSLGEYARLKKCITAIRELGDLLQLFQGKREYFILKWAIYQLVPMFTLATLNICRELYFLTDSEKASIISDNLISSEIPISKRTDIVNATYKIAQGIIQQQYPGAHIPSLDLSLSLKPPIYFEKFYDLIFRITKNPNQYYDVLRLLDYCLQEYCLCNTKFDESILDRRIPNYRNAYIGEKTLLHFIADVCNIPQEFFAPILRNK